MLSFLAWPGVTSAENGPAARLLFPPEQTSIDSLRRSALCRTRHCCRMASLSHQNEALTENLASSQTSCVYFGRMNQCV